MRLIITAALAVLSASAGAVPVKEGQPAPTFTVRAIDGRALSLTRLRGKVVLLDFWTTT